ncbi:hypothetical protein AB0N29_11915 [Nocardioides sp. NPDC092400]|uniref:hypothetical protein n=1 Tax=Nocardioides sp. NPDC092400 TaxID=3155196 RepID=UPI00342D5CD4
MLLRRNTALALGALVLTVPALGSCGFNYATDRVTNYSNTANERSADVDVVGAVIVSEAAGSGTFLATLSNNPEADEDTLEAISGGSGVELEVADFEPYEIAEGGLVSMLQEGGVRVTGDFEPGDFVPLTLEFGNGESVELTVPVHPACDEYEGLDDAPQADGAASTTEAEPYDCEGVSVQDPGHEGSEAPETESE